MLYTGSVNRLIFWYIIPGLFLFYFAFRIFEWRRMDDGGRQLIADQHFVNVSNRSDIDCIILGGSNSVFSLSAEQISNDSNLTCYNLSLLNEGYSDAAYFNFIANLPIDRTKIKTVFYSSVYPLSRESFNERLEYNNNQVGIIGEHKFRLFGRSLTSYLKDYILGESPILSRQYPNPTQSGDFDFELYTKCDSKKVKDELTLVGFDLNFRNWISGNLLNIKSLFQEAEIFYVLPSTLRTNVSDEEFKTFSALLQAEVSEQSVTYIDQSPFPSIDVLCDATHHANMIGREIRTSELMLLMQTNND